MYNVLIVDDDKITIRLLTEHLKKYGAFFTPIYACTGEEAVEIIRQQEISLLITDLFMPGDFDGWALIDYIEKNHLDLPTMVITSCNDTAQIQKLQRRVRGVFEKPVKVTQLVQAVTNILNEDVASGSLHGVSAGSFLQILEQEEKTCTIEIISSSNDSGVLHIYKGNLYDAQYHDFPAQEAACRLIALDNTRFKINPLPQKKIHQRINSEMATILMEAMRLKDEAADQNKDVLTADMSETASKQRYPEKQQSDEGENSPQIHDSIIKSAINTIVIIENETAELTSLIKIFKKWQEEINILTAHEVRDAINLISEQQVDLLICDQSLRKNWKPEALSQLTYAFPDIPCIAIIKQGTLEQSVQPGISYYLERPFTSRQLRQCSKEQLALSLSGRIEGIATHTLLQMLESEEKTCTLKVLSKEDTGFLYMQNGVVIGAETGELKNEEAVYTILIWKKARIEIRYFNSQRQREIHTPLTSLVLTAFHQKDEQDHLELEKQDGQPSKMQFKHEFTTDNSIPLNIGAQLEIESRKLGISLKSMMVGVLHGKYLIVTTPSPVHMVQKALLSEDKIVIKYIHNGKLFMFKTILLKAIVDPHSLLFLSYPSIIHHHDFRSARRAALFIPCTFQIPGSLVCPGVLLDISSEGSLLQVSTKNNQLLSNVVLDEHVRLRCLLPGFAEEQDITGQVKNIRKDHMETKIGIKFTQLPKNVREKIEHYLSSVEKFAQ